METLCPHPISRTINFGKNRRRRRICTSDNNGSLDIRALRIPCNMEAVMTTATEFTGPEHSHPEVS